MVRMLSYRNRVTKKGTTFERRGVLPSLGPPASRQLQPPQRRAGPVQPRQLRSEASGLKPEKPQLSFAALHSKILGQESPQKGGTSVGLAAFHFRVEDYMAPACDLGFETLKIE